jgi:hypothetical protein
MHEMNYAQTNRQQYGIRGLIVVTYDNEDDALTFLLVWSVYSIDSASREAKGAMASLNFRIGVLDRAEQGRRCTVISL